MGSMTKLFNFFKTKKTQENQNKESQPTESDNKQSVITLGELDKYIHYLFQGYNYRRIIPPFNDYHKRFSTNLRDFDNSGLDDLGNLIELKIRLLKNVINVFDHGYNYDDVIDSLLDKSYIIKLMSAFNRHLFNYGNNDLASEDFPRTNRNDKFHVRSIIHRALTDIELLQRDIQIINEAYEANAQSSVLKRCHHFVAEHLSIISLYIGIFADPKYIDINKKFKRIITYFEDYAVERINFHLPNINKLFTAEGYFIDGTEYGLGISGCFQKQLVSSFVLLRLYQDRDWGKDLFIQRDLVELLGTPPVE